MTTVLLFLTLLAPTARAGAWVDVLKQAGLIKEQIRFDPLDLQQVGGAEFQTPFYKVLHGEPLRIPFYARLYREVLLDYAKEPFKAATSSLARVGIGVRRTLEGNPLAEAETAAKAGLVAVVAGLHKKPLTPGQKKDLARRVQRLSPEAAGVAAELLAAQAHALAWRARAFSALDQGFLARAFAERTAPPKREDQEDRSGLSPVLRRLTRDADLSVLMAGGLDLLLAVQRAREKLSALKPADRFEWETPLGLVVVRGDGADNTYAGNKPYLLIIDAGGNDTYYGGGATFSSAHPVSVLMDLSGDDRYLARPGLTDAVASDARRGPVTPAFGAGVFGYGILVDGGGNDEYRAFRHTQGQGEFGLGVLWDIAGDDKYDCWTQCQAAAEFGGGVLIDGGGADNYTALFAAQGFGGPAGAGVLIDSGSAKDTYAGNDAQIDFPSQVDKSHNVSFVQGAAFGVRADGTDGHGLAGGFGALVDGGGDNAFKAGFFAQGVAYWYGVGWLSVGDGKDELTAGKYAQGAAAHFGVGVLNDKGGDDSYRVEQELGIGHGHDYGVGFLLDDGGNDTYVAPNFALGCASAQGMGFFWDRGGNDRYESKEKEIMGCASLRIELPSFRVTSRTLGVFLDTAGRNEFSAPKKELAAARKSGAWVSESLSLSPALDKRTAASLVGVGRVVDEPGSEDPY